MTQFDHLFAIRASEAGPSMIDPLRDLASLGFVCTIVGDTQVMLRQGETTTIVVFSQGANHAPSPLLDLARPWCAQRLRNLADPSTKISEAGASKLPMLLGIIRAWLDAPNPFTPQAIP